MSGTKAPAPGTRPWAERSRAARVSRRPPCPPAHQGGGYTVRCGARGGCQTHSRAPARSSRCSNHRGDRPAGPRGVSEVRCTHRAQPAATQDPTTSSEPLAKAETLSLSLSPTNPGAWRNPTPGQRNTCADRGLRWWRSLAPWTFPSSVPPPRYLRTPANCGRRETEARSHCSPGCPASRRSPRGAGSAPGLGPAGRV